MSVCYFTIVSSNYFAQASVFYESIKKVQPDAVVRIFIADNDELCMDRCTVDISDIFQVADIGIPDFDLMCAEYEAIEFNTAVKPFVFLHLMELEEAYEQITYVDPDTLFISSPIELKSAHDLGAEIILTPHTTMPIEDNDSPNDFDMARAGIYNLGFCSLKVGANSKNFIAWWSRKLARDCVVKLEEGIFVDQKWCDAVPALFDNVLILKHPGYNIGYWNLVHRSMYLNEDKEWFVDSHPVRFFHFSGLNFYDSNVVSKHQKRLTISALSPSLQDLFLSYRIKMIDAGCLFYSKKQYKQRVHELIESQSFLKRVAGIYRNEVVGVKITSFIDFLRTLTSENWLASDEYNSETYITNFIYVLMLHRPDVAAYMHQSHQDVASRESKVLEWVDSKLTLEHSFTGRLIDQNSEYLASLLGYKGKSGPAANWSAFLLDMKAEDLFRVFNDHWSGYQDSIDEVPYVLELLHAARKDLNFDLTTPYGRTEYFTWCNTYLSSEYEDPTLDVLAEVIKDHGVNWKNGIEEVERVTRNESNILRQATKWGFKEPHEYSLFSESHEENLVKQSFSGAKLIGYPFAEMGMGEHVRNTAEALAAVDYPFSIMNFDSGLTCGVGDKSCLRWLDSSKVHNINIFHINADQTLLLKSTLGKGIFNNASYNIAYWAWELEKFPNEWSEAIDLVDEIWVPSHFMAKAMRLSTRKKIVVMPLRVELEEIKSVDAVEYGIENDDFLFMFFFDFSSYSNRKNPRGVIRAFEEAFGDKEEFSDVKILIKTIGEDKKDQDYITLLAERDSRIVVISESLDKAKLNGFLSRCDSFVSLHRSEGFGRGMAEAMYYGKPVIATAYSGNLDFMNEENSFLVDYDLVPVKEGEYVYSAGSRWANPNIHHAAELMKEVYSNKERAASMGQKGQQYIKKHNSTEVISGMIIDRLKDVEKLIAK